MDTTNNTKFMRNLVLSYSTMLIVILIMGLYLYNISIKNVSSEIRNQNKLMLQNAIRDLDTNFVTIDALAGQIANNSNIVRLSNKKDNNDTDFYLLAHYAKEDLAVYIPTETLLPINAYYIYLKEPGYILSYSQFTNTHNFYSGKQKYIEGLYDNWLDMMNDPSYFKRFIPVETYKNNPKSTFLYILSLKNYSLRNIPANIYFEIDLIKLEQLFNELNFYDTGYLYVTNQENELVFSLEGDKAKKMDLDSIVNLQYKNDLSHYYDNEEMFATTGMSDYNKWNYYLIQPANAALYSLEQYRDIFIIIVCLALFVSFVLILLLAKTNAKPVIRLDNELQHTIDKQKTLQKQVEAQKPIIQYSYLNRIMQGGISSTKELEYARQYLSIATDNLKFSVLYLVVYVGQYELYFDNTAITGPDRENYEDIIKNTFYQYFSDSIYIYSPKEREYALLLSSDLEEASEESSRRIMDGFNRLHETLLEQYSIWTIGGLGDWNMGLMITWKSYQQAYEVLSYTSAKRIICSYDNMKRDTNGYYYPIELAGQLTNFITSGNDSQVHEIFEMIRYENMEKHSLPINMMKCLLSDIRNTLYKIRFNIHMDDKNMEELKRIDARFDEHKSFKLYEDIAISLCKIYESKTMSNLLISNIKDYMNDNYSDPSLCLNKISNEFGISESYFSYLFKEEVGENFSVYLERIRLEQAKKLIKETNLNISELYIEVGYNNSNTFRRAFKKLYGVSPKTLRDPVASIE